MKPCITSGADIPRATGAAGQGESPTAGIDDEYVSPSRARTFVIVVAVNMRTAGWERAAGLVGRRILPTAAHAGGIDGIGPAILLNRLHQLAAGRVHHGGARRPIRIVIQVVRHRLKLPFHAPAVGIDADHTEAVIDDGLWLAATVPIPRIAGREVDTLFIAGRGIPDAASARTGREVVKAGVNMTRRELYCDDLSILDGIIA